MAEEIIILLRRIEKLENGNRTLKIIFSLVICVILFLLLTGANKWEKEIITENLNIVDENGNLVAGFKASTFGAGLGFFEPGEFGDMRLWMGLTEEGPKISFFGSNGDMSMEMKLMRGEDPGIGFFDSEEKLIMILSIVEKAPCLVFYGSNQEQRMTIAVVEESPGIVLFDTEGNIIESLH